MYANEEKFKLENEIWYNKKEIGSNEIKRLYADEQLNQGLLPAQWDRNDFEEFGLILERVEKAVKGS